MASTNSTTYYELPQYISTDKPTYLTDWNQAMAKIDAGIHGAKAIADTNALNIGDLASLNTTIKSSIVAALNEVYIGASSVGSLSNLNTTDKSNVVNAINEVNGKANTIGSLLDLNTTNKTSIVNAVNEVKNDASTNAGAIANFNLSTFTSIDESNITVDNGTLSLKNITIAKNSDGSLAKIYGAVGGYPSGASNAKITITGTGLTPTSEFTINNAGLRRSHILDNGTNIYIPAGIDITLKTNGNIEIELTGTTNYIDYVIYLWPMLYWIKDFGDTPIVE